MKEYIPISCTFHDRLEHWSVLRQNVSIVYLDGNEEREVTAVISDVFARGGADYALLTPSDEGRKVKVRLDHIVSVEGILLGQGC